MPQISVRLLPPGGPGGTPSPSHTTRWERHMLAKKKFRRQIVALWVFPIAGAAALSIAAAQGDKAATRVELSHLGAIDVLQEENSTWCQKDTGGTCILTQCWAWRNATNCTWGRCLCSHSECADTDGACRPRAASAQRVAQYSPAWVRQWLGTWLDSLPAVAAAFRSALPTQIFTILTGLCSAGMCGQATPKATNFNLRMTWDEARIDCGHPVAYAVAISAVKYLFWHCLQPISFFVVFYAYANFLEWAQYLLALQVVLREMVYIVVIHVGVLFHPSFLMFQPFTEKNFSFTLSYFASPHLFILNLMLYRMEEAGYSEDEAVTAPSCFEAIGFVCFLSDFCALLALAAGLAGGTLFPAMAAGYAPVAFGAVFLIAYYGLKK